MANVKNLLLSSLVLIAILLSSWTFLLSSNNPKTAFIDPSKADSYMQDVVATVYNKLGIPALNLVTPRMIHYPADKTTQISTPHLTVYRNSPNPWYIDSDFAKTKNDIEEIDFWNNVTIFHPADSNNPAMTVRTEKLNVLPQQQIARTEAAITFIQPDTTIHAIGMQADLAAGTVKLLSKAQGEYVSAS